MSPAPAGEHWRLTLTDQEVELLAEALPAAAQLRRHQHRSAEADRIEAFHRERVVPLLDHVRQVQRAADDLEQAKGEKR